jgi:hypothetical protein
MPPFNARLPEWEVLGAGESIAGNGGSQAADVPEEATIVHMASEGGPSYYQFGAGIATTLSAGFIPESGRVIEGTIRDLGRNGLVTHGAVGVFTHIIYYRENRGH